ncbi:MAG: type II toxin-antitoxin system RelE/ParE family toxin [Bacteroidia bacterium]|nr:type II toxin-antitoxin system RelE/ParE family toxin [Bacteroidia bacterium]
MEIRIRWSPKAIYQLREIFDYYQANASTTVAESIITTILSRTRNLNFFPNMGKREEILLDHPKGFRYLVEGNYKILYWLNEDEIIIAFVIDCRQNPDKIIDIIAKTSE